MRSRFDVVIAGGGPAGLALALHLARDGAAVAVIEPRAARRPRFGETLPPGNRPLLAQLGIWEAFAAGPHARCEGTMAAWGAAEVHYTDYLLHPERHGWRIDRDAFEELLRGEAARHGATMIDGAVTAVARDGDWRVMADGAAIEGGLLVDATGRSALIARRLGARKLVDDQLVGVAGVLEAALPLERGFPLIEAREDGWLYSSVLPGGRLAVVAMTDSDLAHAAQLRDRESWLRWIAAAPHTSRRIEGARCAAAPTVASACSQRLDAIAGPGWLAVGDAASALDPLSSLGIVKALRNAADAAAAIRAGAIDAFAQSVAAEYDRYLDTRARYYAMEARWPAAPFWQRRYRSRSITKSSAISSVSLAGPPANGASAARARSA
jgi:flavin-dependent dehydrogenase